MSTAETARQIYRNCFMNLKAQLEAWTPAIPCLSHYNGGANLTADERAAIKQMKGQALQVRNASIYQVLKAEYARQLAEVGLTPETAKAAIDSEEADEAAKPNSEKYASQIALLTEAKAAATSNEHKVWISNVINSIEAYGSEFAYSPSTTAAWYAGAKQYACRLLRKNGFKRYRKSGKSVAGSAYYEHADGRTVRISDHHLPMTEQRMANIEAGIAGKWAQVVLDDMIPFAEVEALVLEAVK